MARKKKLDSKVVPGPRLPPEVPEVLRIDRPGEEAKYENITFAYPRQPCTRPWPPGTQVPKVRSYVAETVDEFHVHVEMPYAPARKPARVGLSIQEIGASGGLDPHRRTIQPLPLSPAAARELGKLLVEAADMAEKMDAKPYPDPAETIPPIRESSNDGAHG
jgi:hypothetical protein